MGTNRPTSKTLKSFTLYQILSRLLQVLPEMRRLFVSVLIQAFLLNTSESVILRIMPIGNSLTVGSKNVPGAYRAALYKTLANNGYTVDFVGSQTSKDSFLADNNHEGHKSLSIAQLTEGVDTFLEKDPDIILLMVGERDLNKNENFANAAKRYDRLIERIASRRPLAHIFAANLPRRKNPVQTDQIQELFNPYIPDIVTRHKAVGRKITLVDISESLSIFDLETNIIPTESGFAAIANAFGTAIMGAVRPNLEGLSRGVIRVEGGLDRRHVTLTFTKPLPKKRGSVENFLINGNLKVLSTTFVGNQRRVLKLTTSLQAPGATYAVRMLKGVIPSNKRNKFTTGWRMLSFADWHLGEKYVFSRNQDLIDNDVAIIEFLKKNYQGDILMIPGDTNAGFWDRDDFVSEMRSEVGLNLSRGDVVLEAGDRCYSGLLSSFHSGGYPNVLAAIGDHELGKCLTLLAFFAKEYGITLTQSFLHR